MMSSFRSVYRRLVGGIALAAFSSVCLAVAAPVSGYRIVARYPHSTESYTEGFFYLGGLFYEGTGLKGHSALMVIQPETGKVLQRVDLPEEYFGEGIVDWGTTYTSGRGNPTSASSMTASACASSSSSVTPVKDGEWLVPVES